MWKVSSYNIAMTEKDYGISLPIVINGTMLGSNDEIKLTILSRPDGREIVSKAFTDIQNNTVNLELTEVESNSLPVGIYAYRLDWYQSGVFMCNIIPSALFEVVGKA